MFFLKLFLLFEPTRKHFTVFVAFLRTICIYFSTTPSLVTHYSPFPPLISCSLLHLSTSFLSLPCWNSTPTLQPFAVLPLSARFFLSWWNCPTFPAPSPFSVFCWLRLFFLQLQALTCSFITFPSPSLSHPPPHISFHLSRQSASWLTYSQVGRKENEQRAFARASGKSLTDEWVWVKAQPAGMKKWQLRIKVSSQICLYCKGRGGDFYFISSVCSSLFNMKLLLGKWNDQKEGAETSSLLIYLSATSYKLQIFQHPPLATASGILLHWNLAVD